MACCIVAVAPTDIFAYYFAATREFCLNTSTISTIPHHPLSVGLRARAGIQTHTHTHTHTHSCFWPLLIGSDHVRDDPNSKRFIDFTYSSVSTIGIFFQYICSPTRYTRKNYSSYYNFVTTGRVE